jgi:hypothetical protein
MPNRERLFVRFDDDFNGILGLSHQLESRARLFQTQPVCDHLPDPDPMGTNEF